MRFRIAFAVVLLGLTVACGPSSSSPASPAAPPASGTQASIVAGATTLTTNAYSPNPIAVTVGGTVTWTNNDTRTHTATSTTGVWSSGSIPPGEKYSTTFMTAGSFPYFCTIHPGMVGTVVVQ